MFHVRFRLPNDLNQDRRRVELTVLEMFRHKTHPSPAADRLTPITLITTGNQRAYRASNAEMKPLITSSALMPRLPRVIRIRGKVTSRSPRAGDCKEDANSRRAPVSLSFARPADPPVPGGVLSLSPPFPPAASAGEIARII